MCGSISHTYVVVEGGALARVMVRVSLLPFELDVVSPWGFKD